jgi:predicted PurR-regulated permease PerM
VPDLTGHRSPLPGPPGYHAPVNEPPPSAPPPPAPPSAASPTAGGKRAVSLALNTDQVVVTLVRWLLVILIIGIAWYALSYLAVVLWPVVVALAIAYMLDPVLERLVARGLSRAMAARLLLFLFAGALASVVTVLVIFVPHQVEVFIDSLPAMLERAQELSMKWFSFDLERHLTAEELTSVLENALGPLDKLAVVALARTLTVLTYVIELLLMILFAYYLLLEWPTITGRIMRTVPPRRRTYVLDVLTEIDGVVSGWVRGQAIVTSLLAVLYAAAFWIIDLPLAIPLGLVVGALTIIPFIGTFVGLAVTAVVIVLNWPGPGVTIAVGAVFVVLHLLEAAVLTPKIVGHKVGLSESAALFAVLAGGKLLGFIGIVLAVPLAATGAVLMRHLVRRYEKSSFFGDEADALVSVTPAMALMMTQERPSGTVRVSGDDDGGTAG